MAGGGHARVENRLKRGDKGGGEAAGRATKRT